MKIHIVSNSYLKIDYVWKERTVEHKIHNTSCILIVSKIDNSSQGPQDYS